MNIPTSMRKVRDLLDVRARQLRREVAAGQSRDDGTPHEVMDQKDTANARALAEVGSAEVERDLAELRQIAQACERIDSGHYGECSDCGQAIDPRRLLALPAATRCAVCQGGAERHASHT